MAEGAVAVADDLRALLDHVGLVGHALDLEGGEVVGRIDEDVEAGGGVGDAVFEVAGFFGEEDAPGEAVGLFVPADVAGVEVVAERDGDLDEGDEGDRDDGGAGGPLGRPSCTVV